MFSLMPPFIILLNSKILIFFGFRHSFRGLTPLNLKNFDQKLKISIITLKFSRCSSLDVLIIISLYHTIELENFNFFFISSLISWANTFETKNFDQKFKFFIITQIFAQRSSLDILINTSLHNIVELENLIFFLFRHSFRGLTPLKLKNFDKKLNIFIITQIFAQYSSLDISNNTSLHHIVELENFNFFYFITHFVG